MWNLLKKATLSTVLDRGNRITQQDRLPWPKRPQNRRRKSSAVIKPIYLTYPFISHHTRTTTHLPTNKNNKSLIKGNNFYWKHISMIVVGGRCANSKNCCQYFRKNHKTSLCPWESGRNLDKVTSLFEVLSELIKLGMSVHVDQINESENFIHTTFPLFYKKKIDKYLWWLYSLFVSEKYCCGK